MRIEKKVLSKYFQKILDGDKKFEIRLADFECHEGDTLVLKEVNEVTGEYTGRKLEKEVSCVIRTRDLDFWTPEEIEEHGYQVIGFK